MKQLLIERRRYYDSVFLMRISRQLEELPEVVHAVVAMGTPANLLALGRVGFALDDERDSIGPEDLIIGLEVLSDTALSEAETQLHRLLAASSSEDTVPHGVLRPLTLSEALEGDSEIDLALVSVPGAYAAREARSALRRGLHVMLFSDNVSVDDEIALKDEATKRGLLMMGPDCGTAILAGVPLGFANAIRRGSIGIVGASGTGIQEISCLVHRFGGGLSHAIGTGGRDLSARVGGRMSVLGIQALAADPDTQVLVLVSKTPDAAVGERVIDALRSSGKPSVVHFVAGEAVDSDGAVTAAESLEDAARLACKKAGVPVPELMAEPSLPRRARTSEQCAIRGLFCGGTLAQESWSVLHRMGLVVRSNVSAVAALRIRAGDEPSGHIIWDLGDDEFTVGRPHPMIEPALRDRAVEAAADDRHVGVVLVDCVIGYGADQDPAGSLADAATRARRRARDEGRDLLVIASVTGTDQDPQRRDEQARTLSDAGVVVAPSNASAARAAVAASAPQPGGCGV